MAKPLVTESLDNLLARGVVEVGDGFFVRRSIWVVNVEGTIHAHSSCRASGGGAGSDLKLALGSLCDVKLCDLCFAGEEFSELIGYGSQLSVMPALADLFDCVRLSDLTKTLDGYCNYYDAKGGFKSAGEIIAALDGARSLAEQITDGWRREAAEPEVRQRLMALDEARARLEVLGGRDGSFVAAEARLEFIKVSSSVLPGWFHGPAPAVDDSPVLLGVAPPFDRGAGTALCSRVLLAARAVEGGRSPATQLYSVPRFVAEYLIGATAWRIAPSERLMQIVAYPDHDGRAPLDLISALWDPGSAGELSDLHLAVEAAERLSGDQSGAGANPERS